MLGPAVGASDPGREAPSRTGAWDAAGGLLGVLVLGLAFRLIIAYLLPGSGFGVDIADFRFWAQDLAANGLYGFYDRPFFHDYTPGYLYVLWLMGSVAQLLNPVTLGGQVYGYGDLLKLPPIFADLALGWLVWSMVLEMGGGRKAALLGAAIAVANPVSWFDSVAWGQVDSVGVVVLLLGLRELWRDRPERAAVLAMVAALIKPQLGILIPLVAVVTLRRALRPSGAYGGDDGPAADSMTSWEHRVRGPVRIVTTALAGLLTAVALALPFGLSLPGLITQIVQTSGGYPYLTVNAFNPWALVSQAGNALATNGIWICDATLRPAAAFDVRLGNLLIVRVPASTVSCADGYAIAGIPAVAGGAALLLLAVAIVLIVVARRPDRRTMLVGLTVLALAFFILPTRVHERYIYPVVALGAILAAVSWRWRLAYLVSAIATLANLYPVLTFLYPEQNVNVRDWLGLGPVLTSYPGVAAAAIAQTAVFLWAATELRDRALVRLGREIRESTDESSVDAADGSAGEPGGVGEAHEVDWDREQQASWAAWHEAWPPTPPEPIVPSVAVAAAGPSAPTVSAAALSAPDLSASPALEAVQAGPAMSAPSSSSARSPLVLADSVHRPDWNDRTPAAEIGPIGWFRSRLRDRPIRADRSGALAGETGGRLDRLDLWVLAVLIVSLLTVRMWRLAEPYQMHFDEVYHPRTATEFLQDWRYGISHDIYEWTHPHLAKYAMALGIVAWGEDRTATTSSLGVPVTDAAIEPRWDDTRVRYQVTGDRLWLATGNDVRAFDLATRAQVAYLPVARATAVSVDEGGHRVFVGTADGDVRVIDTADLDVARSAGTPAAPQALSILQLDGPVRLLYVNPDGTALVAVLGSTTPAAGATPETPQTETVVTIDPRIDVELGRTTLKGVTQLGDGGPDRIAVADADGIAFLNAKTGAVGTRVRLDGPATGVVRVSGLGDERLYAAYQGPDGPRVARINGIGKTTDTPSLGETFALPGATAGRVYFDAASMMVHVVGSVAPPGDWLATRDGAVGDPTVYVIEPHGDAVYADARLPFTPAAIALDDNQRYPASDRQQLLAFAADGSSASVEIGRHAFAWRVPGVLAGVAMAALLYVLTRLLFKRRTVALLVAFLALVDGMLFVQSRIGMNDSYVGLGIVAAYTLFAALWLRPGGSRRHWLAFAFGMPVIGLSLGLALASKWVAAYAIAAIGLLVLARSALGRLLLIAGLILATTILGYIAIVVPEGQTGGNYVFLAIMVALTLVGVVANVAHPVAWTWAEQRLAIWGPVAAGALLVLLALSTGRASTHYAVGPISATPLDAGFVLLLLGAAVYSGFFAIGRLGFGPMARRRDADDPASLLDAPAPAPRGWLNMGSGFGLPAVWALFCIVAIPVGIYVLSYLPWAMVEGHQLFTGWPPGHTGRTLLELTGDMYRYHNDLSTAHPASSPWWAWLFDLKPVWFYEEGFAGGTAASIYDSGNLVAWWLGIPAIAFVAWQAFARRSASLALVAIAFAFQWIAWARIDRAAFQYHYYTPLPFLLIALAYFLAELWNGPSRRTWLLARWAAALAVLGPFALWLFHRPLCGFVRVTDVNPGSQACPTLIPDLVLSARSISIALVVGIGVVLLLRILLSLGDETEDEAGRAARLRDRLLAALVTAIGVTIAFLAATTLFGDQAAIRLAAVPVEPIALVVTIAMLPVAALVATARDARRFVAGALLAIGFWFVLWYPNLSALPLPANIHNAYQGLLPTYVYPFQFPVSTVARSAVPPPLLAPGPIALLITLTVVSIAIGYSAWTWRVALAERRSEARRSAEAEAEAI